MPSASYQVTIQRPIDEVFAYVADCEHCPAWRPGVLDIRRVSGTGLGERYAQGVRGPMGRRIAADYDSVLRIFVGLHGRAIYVPRVLVKMRVGGASNRSLSNIVRKTCEDYRALRQNGLGGAWTVLAKNLSKLTQFGRAGALRRAQPE